jgi:hypothetical protein
MMTTRICHIRRIRLFWPFFRILWTCQSRELTTWIRTSSHEARKYFIKFESHRLLPYPNIFEARCNLWLLSKLGNSIYSSLRGGQHSGGGCYYGKLPWWRRLMECRKKFNGHSFSKFKDNIEPRSTDTNTIVRITSRHRTFDSEGLPLTSYFRLCDPAFARQFQPSYHTARSARLHRGERRFLL